MAIYMEMMYTSQNPIDSDERINEEALCFCLIDLCSTDGCGVK